VKLVMMVVAAQGSCSYGRTRCDGGGGCGAGG
jgi:hypothetical protein